MVYPASSHDVLRDSLPAENDPDPNCVVGSVNGAPASRRRLFAGGHRRLVRSGSAKVSYAAYIKSDAWHFSPARLAELLASGGKCRICNDGSPTTLLHVHHRTYERLGCEIVSDLTTFCEPCHDMVTAMQRGRATVHRPMPKPIDLPETSGNRTLVDSLEVRR